MDERRTVSLPGPVLGRWLGALIATWLLLACAPSPEEQAAALIAAAESGDVRTVEQLLARGVPPDATDACGATPLMKAALNGRAAVVTRLLGAGARVDAADLGGYTSLLLAASNDHAEVVELLLAFGAAVDAREQTEGYTALLWAAQRGHADTVAVLLRHGADPARRDLQGRTAADRAREGGHVAVLALLGVPS